MSLRKLTVSWTGLVVTAVIMSAALAGCGGGGGSHPVSVAVSASPTTVDPTNTAALTATVTNDKNSAGVTWSVTGGGTLSGTSSSAATYTAPAASSSALTVTVTATSVADTSKSGSVTITVPAGPAITTSTLAPATVGTPYSATLAGAGGIPPYTWAISSGTLPAGLSMTSGGVISGTPLAAGTGTANLTFTMTDSGSPNALSTTATLGLTVNAVPAIAFSTTTLAAGTYNAAYSATVVATGGSGPLTYSLLSGALPAGLNMTAAGVISGTPTAVGTFAITVGAADAFGDSGTQALSLTVSYAPLTITTVTLPTGYVGSVYSSTTLTASGGSGTGYSWSVASGSSLPAGLALSSGGVISGTPTSAGTTSFTVDIADSASNTGSLVMSITVKPAVSITTTTTLPTGYAGSAYSQTLAATGGSGSGYTWAVNSGSSVPAGLSLSTAGALSGTPTTTGTSSFGATVTDSAGNTASASFSITISPGISITAPAFPTGYPGTPYPGATFTATGGNGTYSWTWAAATGSSLPAGLTLSSGGAVSGTPSNASASSVVSNVVVTASDTAGNQATANVSITIEATLAVTTTTLNGGAVNAAYSANLAASGGLGPYTWTTSGSNNLASFGLTLSPAGVLSSTNLGASTGTATFTAQVTDSQGHTATSGTLSVAITNALTVITGSLPATDVGASYSQTLQAAGGTGAGYTWSATASNLSTYGLSLSSSGVVSGTPTQSGTATFTANVTDSGANTAAKAVSIIINAALSLPSPNPSSLPSGYVGIAYSGSVAGSGGSGNLALSVTSGLPSDGLSATPSGATVNISGTPTANATVSFVVSLSDTTVGTSISQTYTIPVTTPTAPSLPTGSTTVPGSATVGTAFNGAINESGGIGPSYTWTVNGAVLSGSVVLGDGLSASSSGGSTLSITGTPTSVSAGVTFTAAVKDNTSNLTSSTQSYTIVVNAAGQNISGQITLNSNCGSGTQPPFTVSINYPSAASPTTVTTDSAGNYNFSAIPNGTYTITPSITGASSSLFNPASASVTVNNAAISGQNFNAAVGYTVSGTVSYSGAQTGQTYLVLSNNNCGGGDSASGTSITETALTSGGAFSIRGVPPGAYTLQAWMDPIGQGAQNKIDPTGSVAVSVTNANVSNANVTIVNPSFATPSSNPTLQMASANAGGAMIFYQPSSVADSNGNSIEDANQYAVQWSTSPTLASAGGAFATVAGSKTFTAIGTHTTVWILNNSSVGANTFTSGTTYYFQARSVNTLATSSSPSGWSTFSSGGNPKGITIGAASCSSNCTTVSGAITIPNGVTIGAGAPLYVGLYQQSSGGKGPSAIYAVELASPVAGANNYSISIPSGSGYTVFGILDQNNDGMIDVGDVTNTHDNGSSSGITVTGSTMTGQNVTLPGVNSTGSATTNYQSNTYSGGSSTNYSIHLEVKQANKMPVAVTLTSGPNFVSPIDMGVCTECGDSQFGFSATLPGSTPAVGDTYNFTVTYSDGTQDTGSTVNGKVTAWDSANGGASVVGAADLPTSLAPSGTSSTSTTPTFTWTFPANPSDFTYSFSIYQTNCSGSCSNIWQLPGNNSNVNGFTYAETGSGTTGTLTWGTDPTGGGSSPTGPLSTGGAQYNWYIQAQDSNGNQAQATTWYLP